MSSSGDRRINERSDRAAAKGGRESATQARRVRPDASYAADWGTADAALLCAAIAAVTRDGGAIRFGYTRDGGAYAVGVYGDGEPYTDYIRPSEDVNDYLRRLYENYAR